MANKTKLQYINNKQFIITLPKGIVLAKGWKKGDRIEFTLDDKGNIILRRS